MFPKNTTAPIYPYFNFKLKNIKTNVHHSTPTHIQKLLTKSQSNNTQYHTLTTNNRYYIHKIQHLYLKQITKPEK